MEITTIATPGLWLGFTALVLGLLALDLGVFHRHAHAVSFREALGWSIVWVALALAFGAWIWVGFGPEKGGEFLAGYVIEKSLAVDNVFVFLVLFSTFAVPAALQHRVLFWGVIGAIVLRAIFIALGAALLARFHWVMYVFGAFLVLTGVKLFLQKAEPDPTANPVFRLFRRLVPSVPTYHGGNFTVRIDGRTFATPLLLVLVCIEISDVVFAVDSIPAIFAVTSDPFIVYTSNIFAILGLRSMFFLLAGAMEGFRFLKPALSAILVFVGAKMLLLDVYHVPIAVSLGVIGGILVIAILASILLPAAHAVAEAVPEPEEDGKDGRSAEAASTNRG
jgi:tellurite resistance protein TerC